MAVRGRVLREEVECVRLPTLMQRHAVSVGGLQGRLEGMTWAQQMVDQRGYLRG